MPRPSQKFFSDFPSTLLFASLCSARPASTISSERYRKSPPTLLTKRLNQLQEAGLVIRKTMPDQRRIEYHSTAASKELKPIILGLGQWGMRWARGQMNNDEHHYRARMDAGDSW
jgi:hypothetical protein